MTRTEKDSAISSLKEKLARAQSLVLADFRGLTVEADTRLRNEFRANGCEYRVVKNALFRKAAVGTPYEAASGLFVGPTAVAYSFDDPAAPARVAARIAKQEEKFVIKGGSIDGRAIDEKTVEALAKLPGKDEMRATFLATLLAAPQAFLRLLVAAPQNFVYLVAARERTQASSQHEGGAST